MATSAARIAANRRNAKLSTGPTSRAGRDRSRANALKHALAARVLRTNEEIEALGEGPEPMPDGSPDRTWLQAEVVLLTDRLRRAGLMEGRLRERSVLRASTCWDGDRRSEAEAVGSALSRDPSRVAARLEETPHGCDWLLERWGMLARLAVREGDWNASARSLAFDLLGTPLEGRAGEPGEEVDHNGRVLSSGFDRAEVIRKEVARLEEAREKLMQVDAFDQKTALDGLAPDLGPDGRRLAKYEAALERRLRHCLDLLGETEAPTADTAEAAEPAPEAVEAPEAEVETPTAQSLPIRPPAPGRRESRANRAERRRHASERKRARRLE